MGSYKNVEELINCMAVCDEPDPLSMEAPVIAHRALQLARLELKFYIEGLMLDEPYVFNLVMPFGDLTVCNIKQDIEPDEIIKFPFGDFTMNAWQKLVADRDNPVFKVLDYFEFNVRGIRNTLAMHGVDADEMKTITIGLLDEHKIMDTYALHAFAGIYDNFRDFI